MTGASPHAPTQRVESKENRPSGVHSPDLIPSFCSTAAKILSAPFT